MEDELYWERVLFLLKQRRPDRLRGNARKEKYKSWKATVKSGYELRKEDESEDLSLKNCLLLKVERQGKNKVVVKKSELEQLWEKFHIDNLSGGHQGFSKLNLKNISIY
jgi:hypothetical protein